MSPLYSAELVQSDGEPEADRSHSSLQRKSVTQLCDGLAVFSSVPTSDITIVVGGSCSGKTSLGLQLQRAATQREAQFYVPTVSCGWKDRNALLDRLEPLSCAGRLLCFVDDLDRLHDVHIRRLLALVRIARDAGSQLSVVCTAAAVPKPMLTTDDVRLITHPPYASSDSDAPLDVHVFELEPLSLDETRELLEMGSMSGLPESDVVRIHGATGGSILMVSEIVASPKLLDVITSSTGSSCAAAKRGTLQTAGSHRVGVVSDDEESALHLVSLGPGIDLPVVAGALGVSEHDAEMALRGLESARLVRRLPGHSEYTLSDEAVKTHLEMVFPPDKRCREHARVAKVYTQQAASGESAHSHALAAWHLAGAGELARAVEHACAALPSAMENARCVIVDELLNLMERAAFGTDCIGADLAASLAKSADTAWQSGKPAIAVRLSSIGLQMLRTDAVVAEELEVELLWNKGRAEALSGSVEGAARTLLDAQMYPLAQESNQWLARLLASWCIVHQMRGEFDQILAAGTRALGFAEVVGDAQLIGSACLAIGNAHHALCAWREARVWYERSVAAAEAVGCRKGVVVREFDIALADFSMGSWELAEARLSRILRSSAELGHAYTLELASNVMGLLYYGRGDFDAARDRFREAMVASRECGDDWGLALSYSNQGALEREFGRPRAALRLFERAQHLMERVGSRDDLPELLRRRAETHIELENADEAEHLATEGMNLAREFKNLLEECSCVRVLSQVAAARGDLVSAIKLANDAVAGLHSIGSKFEEAIALRQLAEIEHLLGHRGDSADSARKALEIFSELSARREAKRTRELLHLLEERETVVHPTQAIEPGRLASLCRSSTTLASARSAGVVLREIADIAASEIPVDVAAVITTGDSLGGSVSSELCRVADREDVLSGAKRTCSQFDDSGPAATILEPAGTPAALEDDVRRAMIVPIHVRQSRFGYIYLDYRTRDARFSDDDVRFVEALAAQAATALENIELRAKLEEEIETLRWEVDGRYAFSNIIGRSVEMQKVFSLLERVSTSSATVLVEGESGTGKELVARAIHHNSKRRNDRFVPQNCAALPEQLLESELFGHVRGAFTGALKEKRGLFEAADGGTFFLDEIADMPPSLQVKLLRVLQDGEIRRVGATDSISVDVRIIAATNKSLEEEVRAGRFRQDLFYRLNVVRVEMPPLRVRRDDIPLLAQHFLDTCATESGKDIQGFTDGAMEHLVNYDWPGNVRELENEMQRAVALAREDAPISEKDLSERIRACEITEKPAKHGAGLDLKDMVEDIERRVILQMLEEYSWNKSKTAQALGLSRQGLLKKIARLKLRRREE